MIGKQAVSGTHCCTQNTAKATPPGSVKLFRRGLADGSSRTFPVAQPVIGQRFVFGCLVALVRAGVSGAVWPKGRASERWAPGFPWHSLPPPPYRIPCAENPQQIKPSTGAETLPPPDWGFGVRQGSVRVCRRAAGWFSARCGWPKGRLQRHGRDSQNIPTTYNMHPHGCWWLWVVVGGF